MNDFAKMKECFAISLGLMIPVSASISFRKSETLGNSCLRMSTMIAGQFLGCIFRNYLEEASPDTSVSNEALTGAAKYSVINFLSPTPSEHIALVAGLGAFNSFAYFESSKLIAHFDRPSSPYAVPMKWLAPVHIEATEAFLETAILNILYSKDLPLSEGALCGMRTGNIVALSLASTIPLAKYFLLEQETQEASEECNESIEVEVPVSGETQHHIAG